MSDRSWVLARPLRVLGTPLITGGQTNPGPMPIKAALEMRNPSRIALLSLTLSSPCHIGLPTLTGFSHARPSIIPPVVVVGGRRLLRLVQSLQPARTLRLTCSLSDGAQVSFSSNFIVEHCPIRPRLWVPNGDGDFFSPRPRPALGWEEGPSRLASFDLF